VSLRRRETGGNLSSDSRCGGISSLLRMRRLTTLLDVLAALSGTSELSYETRRRAVQTVLSALCQSLDSAAMDNLWAQYEHSSPHRHYLRALYGLSETAQRVCIDSKEIWRWLCQLYDSGLDWIGER
jgi:hypothetical protein